jgi:hypothetical protein
MLPSPDDLAFLLDGEVAIGEPRLLEERVVREGVGSGCCARCSIQC